MIDMGTFRAQSRFSPFAPLRRRARPRSYSYRRAVLVRIDRNRPPGSHSDERGSEERVSANEPASPSTRPIEIIVAVWRAIN